MRRNPTTIETAMHYHDAGLCVIPIRPRSKKPPAGFLWRQYQHERPTERDIANWWGPVTDEQYGVGIVCGAVSNNLAALDCDTMPAYERWAADHRELAEVAPTVATARGRHVFLRSREPMRTTIIDGGEIRGEGAYVVAPRSVHPSGKVYRLLSGDFARIPVVESLPSLVIHRADPDTQTHTACVSNVEDAILTTLPTVPGQRNRSVFRLARALKGIEGLDTSPHNLRRIVGDWFGRCVAVVTSKQFSETWTDFVIAWQNVRHPHGGRWAEIVERARAAPDPPESLIYDDTRLRRLAGLCSVLSQHHGGRQFPLSARVAARYLDINRTDAARLLKVLVFDGLIELATPMNRAARLAAEYRWLGRGEVGK